MTTTNDICKCAVVCVRDNRKGYPQGLKQNEIPIAGRLMALADVYDALISKRVYKPPMPHEKAVSIIEEGRGKREPL